MSGRPQVLADRIERLIWKEALMWDDSAALYLLLLYPGHFGQKGAHHEPTVSPDEIRSLWLNATNHLN
jgi:hypothetical protein